MKSIHEILIESDYLEEGVLYEAGLTRLITHMDNPFSILTAFRGEYDLKENRSRNKQLEGSLKSYRMGGIKLIGHWDEAPDGMKWKDAKSQGLTRDLVEESYFVPMAKGMDVDEFENIVVNIGKKFNQDGIVFGDGKDVFLIWKDGTKEKKSGAQFNKVAQAYSQIRRKGQTRIPFIFEGTMQPSGNIHRQILQSRGIQWFSNV